MRSIMDRRERDAASSSSSSSSSSAPSYSSFVSGDAHDDAMNGRGERDTSNIGGGGDGGGGDGGLVFLARLSVLL